MYNILVCDDEKDIVSALTIYLQARAIRSSARQTACRRSRPYAMSRSTSCCSIS